MAGSPCKTSFVCSSRRMVSPHCFGDAKALHTSGENANQGLLHEFVDGHEALPSPEYLAFVGLAIYASGIHEPANAFANQIGHRRKWLQALLAFRLRQVAFSEVTKFPSPNGPAAQDL